MNLEMMHCYLNGLGERSFQNSLDLLEHARRCFSLLIRVGAPSKTDHRSLSIIHQLDVDCHCFLLQRMAADILLTVDGVRVAKGAAAQICTPHLSIQPSRVW